MIGGIGDFDVPTRPDVGVLHICGHIGVKIRDLPSDLKISAAPVACETDLYGAIHARRFLYSLCFCVLVFSYPRGIDDGNELDLEKYEGSGLKAV